MVLFFDVAPASETFIALGGLHHLLKAADISAKGIHH
jgi:hypothetical protein